MDLSPQERQALAILVAYICKEHYYTDWSFAVDISGADIDWDNHPRLIRSQSFGDPDYPSAVLRMLTDIYSKDRVALANLVAYVIGREVPHDKTLMSSLSILGITEGEAKERIVFAKPRTPQYRYIEVETYPDDFYRELISVINRLYNNNLFVPMPILLRKLFENALVDVLRYFYGMQEVDLFFDVNKGRFHDFSLLLENTKKRLADFAWCKDVFNKELLRSLDDFREKGNSMAHTLAVRISKEDLDMSRTEVTHLTKSLFKTILLVARGKSSQT